MVMTDMPQILLLYENFKPISFFASEGFTLNHVFQSQLTIKNILTYIFIWHSFKNRPMYVLRVGDYLCIL